MLVWGRCSDCPRKNPRSVCLGGDGRGRQRAELQRRGRLECAGRAAAWPRAGRSAALRAGVVRVPLFLCVAQVPVSIMLAPYPAVVPAWDDPQLEADYDFLRTTIGKVRERGEKRELQSQSTPAATPPRRRPLGLHGPRASNARLRLSRGGGAA